MPRSKSSHRWLQEHFDDVFVKKSWEDGYRSRAVYKLKEMDEKAGLIRPGMSIVDLGAAPGGWSQYASERSQGKGQIVALDILPMDSLAGVTFIQGDFEEEETLQHLINQLEGKKVDLVLSDMAPNKSGIPAVDIPRAMGLVELAFDFAEQFLKPGGHLLLKIFHGTGFDSILKQARLKFKKVQVLKPEASRARSREAYLLAKGYNL
ncbi:MAG: 23S rRNA (uridine(2552)-2'-O)-methyltransferase RlmE [Legionella sp.]|nr:23S rRNA (uridine(2552)-2'-O)-methyltransferase RlmE [Legionella sp.]